MKKVTVVFLFILFFLSLALTQIITTDTWWNLSDGRAFFSTGAIPATDPYSYVTEGKRWINSSWLSGVLLYPVYLLGGGAPLVLLQVLVVALIFFLLQRIRLQKVPEVSLISLVLSLLIAQPRFQVRAELFGLFSTAVLLWLLFQYQCGRSALKSFFGIALTIIFWTNSHPSFPLGFLVMGVFLVGEPVAAILMKTGLITPEPHPISRKRWFLLEGIFAGSLVATGFTPYGYAIWRIPKFFVDNHNFVSENLNEWIPLSIFWLRSIDPAIAFSIGLAVFGGAFGIAANIKRASISWALLWILSLAMFFSSVRHMSFFAMITLPVLIQNWSRLAEERRWAAAIFNKWAVMPTCALMIFVAMDRFTDRGIIQRTNYEAFGLGFYRRTVPEEAVSFAKSNDLPGRIFNSYDLGSYLMFHWPERKVFIDTRMWFRGAEDFQFYIDLLREPEKHWDGLVEKYDIRTAILKHLSRESDVLLPYLFKHPEWAVVYCDARGIIFVRRTIENQSLIGKFSPAVNLEELFERTEREYKPHWFWKANANGRMDEWAKSQAGAQADQNLDVGVAQQIARPFAHSPFRPFVGFAFPREIPFELYWVAHLYFRLEMYDQAEKAFFRVLEYVPDLHDAYYFLGKIAAERKDFNQAIALFEKSLSLKPDFVPAREELKLSRMLVGFKVIYP